MLYFKCPTCRTVLANKQLIYEQKLEKICNDPKLKGKEKELDEAKAKVLDEIELWRVCCRMRVITYARIVDMIV